MFPFSYFVLQDSLGRADVTLRHAKGKIAENTVYACALPSAHVYARHKGEKGDDFPDVRPSEYYFHDNK